MSDQCKYCTLRGDIDKCLAQDCKQDYWIVDYLLKERDTLKKALLDAQNQLDHLTETAFSDRDRVEKIQNICQVADTYISLGLFDNAREALQQVIGKR